MKNLIVMLAFVAGFLGVNSVNAATESKNNVSIVGCELYYPQQDTIYWVAVGDYKCIVETWDGYGKKTDKWIKTLTGTKKTVNVVPYELPERMNNVTYHMTSFKLVGENKVFVTFGPHWSSEKEESYSFTYDMNTGETVEVDPVLYQNVEEYVYRDRCDVQKGTFNTFAHHPKKRTCVLLWW